MSGSPGSVPVSNWRCARKGGKDNPGCDGVLLGSHGLFTWGETQRECYLNSIHTIDQMGEFIASHKRKKGALFGGVRHAPFPNRQAVATAILPALRGSFVEPRVIAHYTDHEDALAFAGSSLGEGTRRPGHELP